MVAEDFELFDIIEKAGGYVELDATETGERGIPIHDEIVMELTIRPYLDG